ncbi:hypothetical protein [Mucilaginibacter sp.]|uniref:S24 family peptidase n=1 Tax=Mucilaginibacter sp. TaxID=1882438 RepID=UPI0032648734
MHDGIVLKDFIESNSVDVTDLSKKLGIHRTTIYSHYNRDEFKRELKNKYTSTFGVDIFSTKITTLPKRSIPKLQAKPLHLAADPSDFDNDGSRFEELGDGTLRMRVPIIPQRAFAGYLVGFQDKEYYEDLEYTSIEVFKQHRGHYLAFEVSGDSMTTLEPEHFRRSIFDGVKVVGRELPQHQWKYKLHTHNWGAWVIVHRTEGILIKQISKHDVENGIITIHSLNPDKDRFPDQDLHLDDIEQIFNIVKKIDD